MRDDRATHNAEFVRTTAPEYELLTVAEARTHLRLPNFGQADAEEDGYLTSIIAAVGETIETQVRRPIRAQQRDLILEQFPGYGYLSGDWWSWDNQRDTLILNATPIRAVRSITYYKDGVETTLPASDYVVEGAGEHITRRLEISLAENTSWPITDPERSITIATDSGYTQGALPADLKHAARIMVAHFYSKREQVALGTIATRIPMSATHLLAQYTRVIS